MVALTITLHLTPVDVWTAQSVNAEYLPEAFAAGGFIHCTNGEALVIEVGNRYYAADQRNFCLLSIDLNQVTARVIYEDPDRVYPHIYGSLNTSAVVEVRQMTRAEDGTFLGIAE